MDQSVLSQALDKGLKHRPSDFKLKFDGLKTQDQTARSVNADVATKIRYRGNTVQK